MTKLSKILRIVAAAAFLTALAVNVKVTLTDPFVGMSQEAIAQTTSDTVTTVTSGITQTCSGTFCNYLKPELKDVYRNSVTGDIKVVSQSVKLNSKWKNIGYDYICSKDEPVCWCDISKQGRTLY